MKKEESDKFVEFNGDPRDPRARGISEEVKRRALRSGFENTHRFVTALFNNDDVRHSEAVRVFHNR